MQYFGGKSRTADEISSYLKSVRNDGQAYIEPFVGASWIIEKMDGERYGYDKHPYLIAMFKALQNGWIPPTNISEEEYYYIKNNKDENPHLSGFVGFGCSYSGRWFEGFARSGTRNYCLNAHNSIIKKMNNLTDVKFECLDYRELKPVDSLIYCDPPYQGTKRFSGLEKFNSAEFWQKAREWSKTNFVVVSEYKCPDDFVCVWEKATKTDIRNGNNKKELRVEKLFVHKSLVE